MQVHARASLSPIGRRKVIDRVLIERWSVMAAAEAAGVTERTVYRWLARFRMFGAEGLVDRRSTPRSIPRKTSPERAAVICELRQLRLTAAEIAERLGMALSTVSAVLLREGLGSARAWSRRSRPTATSVPPRVSSSTSTSRSSAGSSAARASALPASRASQVRAGATATASTASGSAGKPSTSRSTTSPAWLTSRSCPTSRRPPRSPSCAAPSSSSPATASPSSA